MNIAQLFHKLRIISNVKIVVPLLPEVLRIADQTSRYSLLERLQCVGERVPLRFAEAVGIPTQAKIRLSGPPASDENRKCLERHASAQRGLVQFDTRQPDFTEQLQVG